MTDDSASMSPTLRARVSTGYGRLDEALQGGFLFGSAVVLSAPASDEVPILLRNFLASNHNAGVLICRSLSGAEAVAGQTGGFKCLVCSDKPIPPSKDMLPGKSIDNLTELSLHISEIISSVQPRRIAFDVLSDVLLRHKALQTRKWFTDILTRLKAKGITTLAVINPNIHSKEEAEAVLDIFEGNLEIIEKDLEGTTRKFLRIKWMHGMEVAEKEFLLVDLAPEPQTPTQPVIVQTAPLKEPRWLTPLVSRTAELSKLKAAFENAVANRSSVVTLQGEAGVGKTRLMQELAVYAQSKNAVALSGSASEDGLPYAPWIEITRQYVAQAPGEFLRRMLGSNASELVKLVSDIAAKIGAIPPSKALGEQQDKLRFYEAVTQFFIAISKDAPLLLLFDDMQNVDRSSLDLLEYFVKSTSNMRVLTVCSVPAEHELESSSALQQTLMKFNKQRLLESISVKRLNKDETTRLIKETFGEQTDSPEFADLIYQHTGGNPFFVEEVLRSLVEDGTLFRTETGWDRKPLQDIAMPKSVKGALKSRLTRLDQETVSVLTLAAVFGSEFDFQVLMEVTQTPQETLLERIENALGSGLILEDERRRGVLKFADNRVREVLLDELSNLRRTGYHLRIAEALEKHYTNNLESQAQAIAIHFSKGGDTQRTLKYSIMAGDRNVAVYAYEQAIQDFKRVLDVIESQGGNDEENAKVLEKLAAAYDLGGQTQDSAKYYEQALAIFEKVHDFKACARISVGLSGALCRSKPTGTQDAVFMLKRNLKYIEGDPESFEAAAFYSELATRLGWMDQYDEMNAWVERALVAGEKGKNFEAVSLALWLKASFLLDSGKIDEGMPLLEKSVDLALEHEQYRVAQNNMLNLSLYWRYRDNVKARDLAFQALELNKNHIQVPYQEAAAYVTLSLADWDRGDWPAALDEVNKALGIANRLGFRNDYIVSGELLKAHLFVVTGDFEEAEKLLERSYAKQTANTPLLVYFNLVYGDLRSAQGRIDDAKAHYETCVNAFKEQKTQPDWYVEPLVHLISIYAERGQLEEARRTSEWATRLAEQFRSDPYRAMALQAEASVLLAAGDQKAAEEAYLKSLALCEKAGWPYYHANVLVGYSEAVAQTNPEESKKRLQQAAEIFKKLGAKRDLERADARLSS